MAGLDMNREYIVPLITDEEGGTTAIHLYRHNKLGVVLWLFTSPERGHEFLSAMLGQDPTRPYMEVLEQEFGRGEPRYSSEDLNFGERYSRKTVQELLPELEVKDVHAIMVDPGAPGQWERVYPSPHKA